MTILERIAAARARFAGGPPQAQAPTQPGAAEAAPGAGAASASAAGLTMEGLLAQLAEQRPALEERFTPTAILFAQGLRTARKIFPEAEERITYAYLTAVTDDAQFGGKVLFCQRAAEGPDAGKYVEVEGTRQQQIENFWAEALPHSLADERIAAVQSGRTQAFALPAVSVGPAGAQAPKRDANDGGVDMEDEAALALTTQGQAVLEGRKQAAATAPGSTRVN